MPSNVQTLCFVLLENPFLVSLPIRLNNQKTPIDYGAQITHTCSEAIHCTSQKLKLFGTGLEFKKEKLNEDLGQPGDGT